MNPFGRKTPGTEAEEATVPGERGIASVNRAASLQSRVSSVLAIGLMSTLGLSLLTWYYAHTYTRRVQATEHAQAAVKNRAQGEMPLPALGPITAPRVLGPAPSPPKTDDHSPVGSTEAAVSYTAAPTPASAAAPYPASPEKSPAQRALERRLAGPAFAERGREGGAPAPSLSGAPVVAQAAAGGPAVQPAPVEGATGSLAGLLRPTVTTAARAEILPTERFLLPKGAFIDCTLETAIDSGLPGMTTCITATDTFSADGTVVLLERGTKLVGETRGEVQQGSSRLFVLWTEARTPTGVIVPLASPGTDELGRSGLSGEINRHFWQRFGAAILISAINGAVQSGVQASSNGSAVIIAPTGTQDVMTEVLKSTVNIPPTVTKQNGDRIQVLVARDLDFRSVYELHTKASRQ